MIPTPKVDHDTLQQSSWHCPFIDRTKFSVAQHKHCIIEHKPCAARLQKKQSSYGGFRPLQPNFNFNVRPQDLHHPHPRELPENASPLWRLPSLPFCSGNRGGGSSLKISRGAWGSQSSVQIRGGLRSHKKQDANERRNRRKNIVKASLMIHNN